MHLSTYLYHKELAAANSPKQPRYRGQSTWFSLGLHRKRRYSRAPNEVPWQYPSTPGFHRIPAFCPDTDEFSGSLEHGQTLTPPLSLCLRLKRTHPKRLYFILPYYSIISVPFDPIPCLLFFFLHCFRLYVWHKLYREKWNRYRGRLPWNLLFLFFFFFFLIWSCRNMLNCRKS